MATLKSGSKSIEVKDGENISKAAEELGVPIPCGQGICGACKIQVIKGMENLSSVTSKEKDMGINPPYRLACQCKIKKGVVEFRAC
ncbi:MAG: 2Fe-2S iron-sulfur cluster-binding protein [Candidatus Pacearchaeota archaeon]